MITFREPQEKLFEAANGKDADCSDLTEKDRIIRADTLSWLCTNPETSAQMTHRGVSITGAEIDGKVDLEWAKISFPLQMPRCVFTGAIILQNSHLVFLNLAGSSIQNLDATCATIEGNVILAEGFKAAAGVNLVGAKIDGDLDCRGGKFCQNGNLPALGADDAKIEGNVFLSSGFKADGSVSFFGSSVGRRFRLCSVDSPKKMRLDLRQTKVGTLFNSQDSWPAHENLFIDGCTYDRIDDLAAPNAAAQLGWICTQPRQRFLSQPYDQLAAVLDKMGLEEEARRVMIAKNREHARHIIVHRFALLVASVLLPAPYPARPSKLCASR